MITVQLNKDDFAYDIHSLVKAFFPSENVSVCTVLKEKDEPVSMKINVDYQPDQIALTFTDAAADSMRDCFPVNNADRSQTKNLLKKHLYQMLSVHTKKTLPWGTLTGIRPTKIPMTMLEKGEDLSAIADFMQKNLWNFKRKDRTEHRNCTPRAEPFKQAGL